MASESVVDKEITTSLLLPTPSVITTDASGGETRRSPGGSATVVLVLSTLVAVFGSYVFGSALGFSSPAQSGIQNDLGLTLAEYSLFGSISTIGAMIGAVGSGQLADILGRRGAMGFAELLNTFGWLAIASAKNVWWLDLGRILTGFGVGILSYVVPVYIAEITPKDLRGVFTAVNQVMISCGLAVMYLAGNYISWRILALVGIIPCVIQLIGIFFIPESPRWLAKVDEWEASEKSLLLFRGKNACIFEEAAEIRDYTRVLKEQHKNSRIIDLFQRKYAHSLVVGVGLMVLQQFGGVNAISYYASSIFSSAGFSSKLGTTGMAFVKVPMTVFGSLLLDKSGRRPLLMVSASGTCLGCFFIGLSFLLQDLKLWSSSPLLAFAGVLIFVGSFSFGMGGIPWVIMTEIFPMNVKGLAGSLTNVVCWFGTLIVTYSFNFVARWNTAGTFFVFSAVSGFTVMFVVRLVPETKGRSLEEIQASMVS